MTTVAERRAVPPPSSASTSETAPSLTRSIATAQLASLRLIVVSRGSWMAEACAHIWPTIIRRMCGRATEQIPKGLVKAQQITCRTADEYVSWLCHRCAHKPARQRDLVKLVSPLAAGLHAVVSAASLITEHRYVGRVSAHEISPDPITNFRQVVGGWMDSNITSFRQVL